MRKRKRIIAEEDPIINSLHRLLAEMDQRMIKNGIERKPNETIHQFANRITARENDAETFNNSTHWYIKYAFVRYAKQADSNDLEHLKAKMP